MLSDNDYATVLSKAGQSLVRSHCGRGSTQDVPLDQWSRQGLAPEPIECDTPPLEARITNLSAIADRLSAYRDSKDRGGPSNTENRKRSRRDTQYKTKFWNGYLKIFFYSLYVKQFFFSILNMMKFVWCINRFAGLWKLYNTDFRDFLKVSFAVGTYCPLIKVIRL